MAITETAPTERELPPYFAVSPFKFAAMAICTFGFYEIWWFYVNWCRIKKREQSNISPGWRAVFAGIWCYPCLCRIRGTARDMNLRVTLPAGPLTTAWFITALLANLPEPWSLVCFLAPLWLLPAQIAATRINAASVPDHDPNERFSGGNWLAIILGGGLLILVVIGLSLPPQPED